MVDAPQKVAYSAAAAVTTSELGKMNIAIIETQEREAASWSGLVDRYVPRASKVVTRPPNG
jgi:hypothetical protein